MAKLMFFKTGVVVLSLLYGAPAVADTVFIPPQVQGRGMSPSGGPDEEQFPASRFGSDSQSGSVSQGYAAREAGDMDEAPAGSPQDFVQSASRAPASARSGYGQNYGQSVDQNGWQNGGQEGQGGQGGQEGMIGSVGALGESPITTSQAAASQDIPPSLVARKGVQEVSVIASDLGFFPKTLFVSRDVPVRMYVTGSSKNTLCIMMDAFQVRKQVRAQKIEEITFVPSMPGKYRFYCPVNGMEGSLVVKELEEPAFAQQAAPSYRAYPQAALQEQGQQRGITHYRVDTESGEQAVSHQSSVSPDAPSPNAPRGMRQNSPQAYPEQTVQHRAPAASGGVASVPSVASQWNEPGSNFGAAGSGQ